MAPTVKQQYQYAAGPSRRYQQPNELNCSIDCVAEHGAVIDLTSVHMKTPRAWFLVAFDGLQQSSISTADNVVPAIASRRVLHGIPC